MEDNIVDRFLSIPKMEKISKNNFEASLGKSSGYFNVLKRNGSVPSSEILQIFISKYPKYSLRWILLGEGSPLEEKIYSTSQADMLQENPDYYQKIDNTKKLFVELLLEGLNDQNVMKRIQEITGRL